MHGALNTKSIVTKIIVIATTGSHCLRREREEADRLPGTRRGNVPSQSSRPSPETKGAVTE